MDLRYRYRPCRETDLTPGSVTSRGPDRYVDKSWQDQEDPSQDVEMVRSTRVGQSHAITSSSEETDASKQQEQSIPMKYPSEEFIQIDRRKWNGIPACDGVERFLLLKKIEKVDSTRSASRT